MSNLTFLNREVDRLTTEVKVMTDCKVVVCNECEKNLKREIERADQCEKINVKLSDDSKFNETRMSIRIRELELELVRSKNETQALEANQKENLDGMSVDFQLVSEARECLQQCGELTKVGDKYMCVATDTLGSVCTTKDSVQLRLSGILSCVLLGDETFEDLDWSAFLKGNPRVGSILICVLIFALNGVLLSLLWICVCLKWRFGRNGKIWKLQPRIASDSLVNQNFVAGTGQTSQGGGGTRRPIIKNSNPSATKGTGKMEVEL